MAHPIVCPPWLFATVRLLGKRIHDLEKTFASQSASSTSLNPGVPEIVPRTTISLEHLIPPLSVSDAESVHLFYNVYHKDEYEGIHTIAADTSNLPFRKFAFDDDGEQHEYGDVETEAVRKFSLGKHVVQHQYGPDSGKSVEVPQIQYTDKIVEVPVQKSFVPLIDDNDKIFDVSIMKVVEVPTTQKVEKSVGVPQIQHIDKIVDVPVQKNFAQATIQKVQTIVEVPQSVYIDKIVDVPAKKIVDVLAVQKVEKTIEVPQVQYLDKIVDVPVQKNFVEPMIQKDQTIVEVPQSVCIDKIIDVPAMKIVDVPAIQKVQGNVDNEQDVTKIQKTAEADAIVVTTSDFSPHQFVPVLDTVDPNDIENVPSPDNFDSDGTAGLPLSSRTRVTKLEDEIKLLHQGIIPKMMECMQILSEQTQGAAQRLGEKHERIEEVLQCHEDMLKTCIERNEEWKKTEKTEKLKMRNNEFQQLSHRLDQYNIVLKNHSDQLEELEEMKQDGKRGRNR